MDIIPDRLASLRLPPSATYPLSPIPLSLITWSLFPDFRSRLAFSSNLRDVLFLIG
jgi:hypothetical protein